MVSGIQSEGLSQLYLHVHTTINKSKELPHTHPYLTIRFPCTLNLTKKIIVLQFIEPGLQAFL
jgi:hypothetical protein